MADAVFHPVHYSTGRFTIECIAITRHMSCCAANAFKYVFRHAEKNGIEDLRKAAVYLRWAIEDGGPAPLEGRRAKVVSLIGKHVMPSATGVYEALLDIGASDFDSALHEVEREIERLTVGAA
ncbi:DUF3310 domain-containing protein [Nocardia asiatica]|uniref:DUF3310 domain-containing protein n=1 Tax=Nocardia asiatica TaxID=209252 RepID=UPI0024587F18|nr:DUF3310 domain-containing protein [Nocardia asiatica]